MTQQQKRHSEDKKIVNLGRVLQILREEENVDVLIETTLNYLQSEFQYDLIWLGLYDHIEHRILGKGGITPNADVNFLKQKFFLQPGDLLEQVVIQQRPIGVPDLGDANRAGEWRKAALNFKIRGTLMFPIRHRDRCFGVVILGLLGWGISPQAEEKAQLSVLLGTLAASLNQIEINWNRQRTKRPDEPLLAIMQKLPALPTMLQRLEAIVAETHQFVNPTRTNIYWFEPDKRYFWRYMSNRLTGIAGDSQQSASGITVQESGSFYSAMLGDQIVAIGESLSSLKADVTSRLLQRMGARSLLAAPILLQDELLGFLSVEGSDPRIWKEEEKNYLRGAARIIALVSPIEEMETTIKQTKQDQILLAEIAKGIYSEEDWLNTLKEASDRLKERFQSERFLVLLFDSDHKQFEISYQNQPMNRRPLGSVSKPAKRNGKESRVSNPTASPENPYILPHLSDVDWKLLERSSESVVIEDLTTDLKLLSWRDGFLEAGVRSILVCNTSIGKSLKGLLMITCESARTFTAAEKEVFRVVSQQIGLILQQWQIQKQSAREQKTYQTLQWGLTMMQQNYQNLQQVEESALKACTNLLEAPIAALISWLPGEETAKVSATTPPSAEFTINTEQTVAIYADELIQEALNTDGLIYKNIQQLTPTTKQWLTASGVEEIIVMALRTTPEHFPTGVVVVCNSLGHHWPESALPAFGLLMAQFAWFRRESFSTSSLQQERQELQCLNWYKHRAIEDFCRTVASSLKVFVSLAPKEAAQEVRYQQLCSQLSSSVAAFSRMLARELWSTESVLQSQSEDPIRVTSLLRRSLERVDDLIKSRRLWAKVHDAGDWRSDGQGKAAVNSAALLLKHGSTLVQLVVYELLLAACQRGEEGGRIDIWYRQLNAQDTGIPYPQCFHSDYFLELSITDTGNIDPQLIADLQKLPKDDLAPHTLRQPPGLHIRICQLLISAIGGFLNLYILDDGRILTQVLVPIDIST